VNERRSLPGKIALAAEVVCTYVRVRWWLWRRDLPSTLAAARGDRPPLPEGSDPYREGVRLGFAVSRTLRFLPTDSRCLSRSLVLTAMLARRRIESALVIGVRPGPDFGAHAWVEHRGRPLLAAGPTQYRRLMEL
jgi:Transglutaminase-like superfamily